MAPPKATFSLRIYTDDWLDPHGFAELCATLRRYPDVAEEISLFHSITHAPLRLEIVRERSEVLKERMKVLRAMGYRTGVNILTTIGHHEENLPNAISVDEFTPMTDITGGITRGSFCPNDPRMLDYVRELYRIIAAADPDYIWIDDDIRLWHWPNGMGCFCDRCLAIFTERHGTVVNRESLHAVVNGGTAAEKFNIRKAWLDHTRAMFVKLLKVVESAAHAVTPDLELGQMTGDRFWEGYDFDTWATILAGPNKIPVLWRPGGGVYREGNPWELVQKSSSIARQTALLPPVVRSVQAEIERIPANRFGKSAAIAAVETPLLMAAGATGAAVNSLREPQEPFEECYPVLDGLRRTRPFCDLLVRTFGDNRPIGLCELWNKDTIAAINLTSGDWFGQGDGWPYVPLDDFLGLGLPVTFTRENAVVTLLTGDSILAQPDQAERILACGVYLDAAALTRLNDLGYGELTGFRVERIIHQDAIEVFTDHPLNAGITGRRRDARQSFLDFSRPAAVLAPTDPKAQSLSRLIDYTPRDLADCGTGVFENRLGGRVCVAGYFPWTLLYYVSKHRQLQNVMRWLSRDTLPAYAATFHRTPIWVRRTVAGGLGIALINAHFDPIHNPALVVKTRTSELRVFDMNCNETRVPSSHDDGVYHTFTLPGIGAWEMRLAVIPCVGGN